MIPAVVAVVAVAVVATLAEEPHDPRRARGWKMIASTGFLVVAGAAGAFSSRFGITVLVALVASWIGDLALTFPGRRAFRTGLVAFAFAHLAYLAAFAGRGLSPAATLAVGAAGAVAAALVWWWLAPSVPSDLRGAVLVYLILITAMVAAAAGTAVADPDLRIAVGAGAFYLSDLAVARDRFLPPPRHARRWGLPLYYLAQVLLALAAGG